MPRHTFGDTIVVGNGRSLFISTKVSLTEEWGIAEATRKWRQICCKLRKCQTVPVARTLWGTLQSKLKWPRHQLSKDEVSAGGKSRVSKMGDLQPFYQKSAVDSRWPRLRVDFQFDASAEYSVDDVYEKDLILSSLLQLMVPHLESFPSPIFLSSGGLLAFMRGLSLSIEHDDDVDFYGGHLRQRSFRRMH